MKLQQIFALLTLSLMTLINAPQALAWGEDGHKLICAIAEANLTSAGKQFLKEVTADGEYLDGNGKMDFVDACIWPDEARFTSYKGTYEQHFINIPESKAKLSLGRDCEALDCIAVGIQRNLVYLKRPASGNREKARRNAALRFVGHFIGDLHQPLHVSNAEDWGGNKIKVIWAGEETNLHALWDTILVRESGLSYPASVKLLVAEDVEDPDLDRNVLNWMTESFNLARAVAYKNTADRRILIGETIERDYFVRAKPVIHSRIQLAGHRLAYLINHLAEGDLDTNILIR